MESWLIRITDYVLAQSWQIAVLTVAVAILSAAMRNRSTHVRYLLWLIVLAKCFIPPLHSISVPILPPDHSALAVSVPTVAPAEWTDLQFETRLPTMTSVARQASAGQSPMPSPEAKTERQTMGIRARMAVVWMFGVIVFLLGYLLKALRMQTWLHRRRRELPAALRRDVQSVFSVYGIERWPAVWLIEGVGQPFVWGFVRGSIYVPASAAQARDPKIWPSLIGHELSHVLRFDAAVNVLQVIAQIAFWFHPLVWWANRKIRQEREKCCDEMTIARLHSRPEDYSSAIVEVLAAQCESTRPVPSLGVAGSVRNIEERIRTMLRPGKKFHQHPSIVAAVIVIVMALFTIPTELVLTSQAADAPEIDAASDSLEVKAPPSTTPEQIEPTKPIIVATADGDIDQVRLYIARGVNVNMKTSTGDTPLHYAARHGHRDIAEALIAAGADIDAANNSGLTPAHVAFMTGQHDDPNQKQVLDLLIAKGAKISCIQFSAFQGDLAKVRDFIEQGTDVDAKDYGGRTALHYAADHGYREMVEFLIDKGADVNSRDNDGFISLHWAESPDMIRFLIAKGADVKARDRWGWTPLDGAAWQGRTEDARLLIEAGADVNSRYTWGETPLIWASKQGHINVSELLLSKGADINAQNQDARTPLHFAVIGGHIDLVRMLIEEDADKRPYDPFHHNDTLLHHAASRGHVEIAKLLIAAGLDASATDNRGRTPLWIARQGGFTEMIELLRQHGATE